MATSVYFVLTLTYMTHPIMDQAALSGRTVIEYPTLYFGSIENTRHLNMKVAEIGEVLQGAASVSLRADSTHTDAAQSNLDVATAVITSIPSSPSSSSGPHLSPLCEGRKRGSDSSGEGAVDGIKRVRTDEVSACAEVSRACSGLAGDALIGLHGEQSVPLNKEGTTKEHHVDVLSATSDAIGREEEDEEGDEEEEEDEGAFFSALKEFEGKDIEALKAFISSHEH